MKYLQKYSGSHYTVNLITLYCTLYSKIFIFLELSSSCTVALLWSVTLINSLLIIHTTLAIFDHLHMTHTRRRAPEHTYYTIALHWEF